MTRAVELWTDWTTVGALTLVGAGTIAYHAIMPVQLSSVVWVALLGVVLLIDHVATDGRGETA